MTWALVCEIMGGGSVGCILFVSSDVKNGNLEGALIAEKASMKSSHRLACGETSGKQFYREQTLDQVLIESEKH
jgi:hypothetical protein